jgi:serine/threonine protein kinase
MLDIIMELITGGELFDKIVEIEHYSEADAANLMKQIADAVQICHDKNVVHRDLKPENLLFEDPQSNKLKLIDFGVAEVLEPGKSLKGIVGSRTYMAPEVAANVPYGKPVGTLSNPQLRKVDVSDRFCRARAIDMYSAGIIMYILLCGFPPFDPEQGIVELEYPSPEWDDVSQTAKGATPT